MIALGANGWQVICADALMVLAALPDKSVDHVITDPPYDARTHENAKTSKDGGGRLDIPFEPLSCLSFVAELLRVARQWVVCFCALEQLGAYRDSAAENWVRAGIWNRQAGTAFARADRPYQGAEGIAIMSAAKKKIFPAGARRAVWESTTERDRLRAHPTAKPIALMRELVADFTRSGDLILDPFAGSGTTGVAALHDSDGRGGRRVVLVEREPEWAKLCEERLAADSLAAGFLPNGSPCNPLESARAGQGSLLDRMIVEREGTVTDE